MTMAIKGEPQRLTLRQQKGRAVNAIAKTLQNKLLVPNIYLQPRSPLIAADVLAVDRAGAGDLHAVDIELAVGEDFNRPDNLNEMNRAWMQHVRRAMKEIRDRVMSLPAHYRYLALPHDSLSLLVGEIATHLYSLDGIGKIGIIAITDRGEEPPTAEISIAPERFRIDPAKLHNIEKRLLERLRPDIEVRI